MDDLEAELERSIRNGWKPTVESFMTLVRTVRQLREQIGAFEGGLAGLGIQIRQHQLDPQPDAWYWLVGGIDGGPCPTPAAALSEGLARWVKHSQESRTENEELSHYQIRSNN